MPADMAKLYMAKLAEQAECYDEMLEYMQIAKEAAEDLTLEERHLLSVAYKNAVGLCRASLRIISSIERKVESKGGENAPLVKGYREHVKFEFFSICHGMLPLLKNCLIPKATGLGKENRTATYLPAACYPTARNECASQLPSE